MHAPDSGPVANALGDGSWISHSFGIGKPMRWVRLCTIGNTRAYTSGFSCGVTGCAEYIASAILSEKK